MVRDSDNDEVFDEEELAEGFDEEIVGDDIDADELDTEDLEVDELDVDEAAEDAEDADIVEDADDAEDVVEAAVAIIEDDDDVVDDSDVELALDEVLAETILRTSVPEDDDEVSDPELGVDVAEAILPKQDDEFRCSSCRLLKKTSQLADAAHMLCRDCV